MNRTALAESLALSEKNQSIVKIKIINTDKPLVGAVQKVLNHIIILKSANAEPVTLVFGDIESVKNSSNSFLADVWHKVSNILHRLS